MVSPRVDTQFGIVRRLGDCTYDGDRLDGGKRYPAPSPGPRLVWAMWLAQRRERRTGQELR